MYMLPHALRLYVISDFRNVGVFASSCTVVSVAFLGIWTFDCISIDTRVALHVLHYGDAVTAIAESMMHTQWKQHSLAKYLLMCICSCLFSFGDLSLCLLQCLVSLPPDVHNLQHPARINLGSLRCACPN